MNLTSICIWRSWKK